MRKVFEAAKTDCPKGDESGNGDQSDKGDTKAQQEQQGDAMCKSIKSLVSTC